MSENYCPICYSKLEVKEVAPCMECGHLEEEIQHAIEGKHTYSEMRVFNDLCLILCNFCQVDFGSYKSETFNLAKGKRIGFENMQFLREITDHSIRKDKVCSNCMSRLPFLKFLSEVREFNKDTKE